MSRLIAIAMIRELKAIDKEREARIIKQLEQHGYCETGKY